MKKEVILFWVTTVLFSGFMMYSGYNYLFSEGMKAAFEYVGFPQYFKIELGIAKLLGGLALLLPFVPSPAKVFAYVGFTINLISAMVLHLSMGESISSITLPVLCLIGLGISYWSFQKQQHEIQLNGSKIATGYQSVPGSSN